MANVEMIRPYVEQRIAQVLGIDKVESDGDGDIPIRSGSAAYYVRLLDSPDGPVMRVFSPVVLEVDESPQLIARLNELNRDLSFVRYFWVNRSVICAMDVFAEDIQISEIAHALRTVAFQADHVDDTLKESFGGKVFFTDAPTQVADEETTTGEKAGASADGAAGAQPTEAENAAASEKPGSTGYL